MDKSLKFDANDGFFLQDCQNLQLRRQIVSLVSLR